MLCLRGKNCFVYDKNDGILSPQYTMKRKDMYGRPVAIDCLANEYSASFDNPDDFVFGLTPSAISRRYEQLRDRLGLHHVRFHDLRHFSASFRSDIGIPKKYIELEGGWEADSKVLSSVYDNPLESSRRKYSQMVNEFIDDKFGDAIKASS